MLYLALAKTAKEAGIRFRCFMVDDVMPQIARAGAFKPKDAPPPAWRQSEDRCADAAEDHVGLAGGSLGVRIVNEATG